VSTKLVAFRAQVSCGIIDCIDQGRIDIFEGNWLLFLQVLQVVEGRVVGVEERMRNMANQEKIGSMEEEARKRKERLKAWKRKHDETGKEGDNSEEGVFNLPRLVLFMWKI
jgi:hypothetical protein